MITDDGCEISHVPHVPFHFGDTVISALFSITLVARGVVHLETDGWMEGRIERLTSRTRGEAAVVESIDLQHLLIVTLCCSFYQIRVGCDLESRR